MAEQGPACFVKNLHVMCVHEASIFECLPSNLSVIEFQEILMSKPNQSIWKIWI